jgi:ATP-dependent DNA helicase RecQ
LPITGIFVIFPEFSSIRQFSSRKKKSVAKTPEATYQITYELLQKDHSIEEIAKERGLTIGTIYSHIGKLMSQKSPIDLGKLVPIEKQIQIINAAQLLNQDKLKPLKDYLGNDFSYDEIRLTLISKD